MEAPPELRLAASQNGGNVRISHGQDFTDLVGRLDLKHGLGRVRVDFSLPNPVKMARLNMGGGAGELDLRNLGNQQRTDQD